MVKKILSIILLFVFLFLVPTSTSATENPLASPNNRFGIHIHDENDLEDAAKLINSTGGDWGYITLVIPKGDRNKDKWQRTFDKIRRLHLIPIVRLATQEQNGGWEKGKTDEIPGWVNFLNELNWIVKNRYIIIGNEPNHAIEWGNELNPEEYSDYLLNFAKALKQKNQDFFVLPAAMDASAPTNHIHLNSSEFLRRMINKNANIFDYIDGWNSHSYPNPEFSGSVYDNDAISIKSYTHELNLLNNLGVKKELPVFITETGWAHNQNEKNLRYLFLSPNEVGKRLTYAYENIWTDKNIVAVTPFIINYQSEPFLKFSWKDKLGDYYSFYQDIENLPKTKGKPIQVYDGELSAVVVPAIFKNENQKYGYAYAKNTGQAIWNKGESIVAGLENNLVLELIYPESVEPGRSGLVYFGKIE
ncbi:MAG: hypothetical protein US62_C0012G0015 [Candidatus Woesebacteria bacterium GW2011_GWA1_37_8]|uniref:Glycoside hydrolase family 5 domain-containing protein n=2 Tax=Candidatus Woeseibacteriota TaxID=1752722 RepID=A0A0G0PC08_9BACT|nr:MAG: hypothetical protein US39_C0021G0003 [Microgenomates group bacterium GW2011_GWC1_37_12b]KKQ45601.1 MAG: hypothetical protein US62_C0012G0015 [Candidatus Woesebacteria bacterium GW2011_GWA1_37_8]KKQ86821.1 MAG: hypothetical protein UT10_C0016G0015 [Candidatus Woesebacteria bacterium GW2011_GWB1_38_8b]